MIAAHNSTKLLKTVFGAREVILFGSLARRGRFSLFSDIDLAVRGIAPEKFLAASAAIEHVAVDFQVDLADLEACPRAILKKIEKAGKPLWPTKSSRNSLSTSITNSQKRVAMKEELFSELLESVYEGGPILLGEKSPSRNFAVEKPDVQQIRATYRLSQKEFALMLGISTDTLQDWEQGLRPPKGPARVLLQVAAKHPEAVWDVIKPKKKLADKKRPRSQRNKAR